VIRSRDVLNLRDREPYRSRSSLPFDMLLRPQADLTSDLEGLRPGSGFRHKAAIFPPHLLHPGRSPTGERRRSPASSQTCCCPRWRCAGQHVGNPVLVEVGVDHGHTVVESVRPCELRQHHCRRSAEGAVAGDVFGKRRGEVGQILVGVPRLPG